MITATSSIQDIFDPDDEIVRMRIRLRGEHDNILKVMRENAIQEADKILKSRILYMENSWSDGEITQANEIITLFEKIFDDLHASEIADLSQMNIDNTLLSGRDAAYSNTHAFCSEDPITYASIENCVSNVYAISQSYVTKKKVLAEEKLNKILQRMIDDAEIEGEALWTNAASKAAQAWSQEGKLRLAFDQSMMRQWEDEDNLVGQYLKDQVRWTFLPQHLTSTRLIFLLERAIICHGDP